MLRTIRRKTPTRHCAFLALWPVCFDPEPCTGTGPGLETGLVERAERGQFRAERRPRRYYPGEKMLSRLKVGWSRDRETATKRKARFTLLLLPMRFSY